LETPPGLLRKGSPPKLANPRSPEINSSSNIKRIGKKASLSTLRRLKNAKRQKSEDKKSSKITLQLTPVGG